MVCPKCKGEIESGSIFCPFCGEKVKQNEVNIQNSNKKKQVLRTTALIFAIVATIVGFFIFVASSGLIPFLQISNVPILPGMVACVMLLLAVLMDKQLLWNLSVAIIVLPEFLMVTGAYGIPFSALVWRVNRAFLIFLWLPYFFSSIAYGFYIYREKSVRTMVFIALNTLHILFCAIIMLTVW